MFVFVSYWQRTRVSRGGLEKSYGRGSRRIWRRMRETVWIQKQGASSYWDRGLQMFNCHFEISLWVCMHTVFRYILCMYRKSSNFSVLNVSVSFSPLTVAVLSQWCKMASSPNNAPSSMVRTKRLSLTTWTFPSEALIDKALIPWLHLPWMTYMIDPNSPWRMIIAPAGTSTGYIAEAIFSVWTESRLRRNVLRPSALPMVSKALEALNYPSSTQKQFSWVQFSSICNEGQAEKSTTTLKKWKEFGYAAKYGMTIWRVFRDHFETKNCLRINLEQFRKVKADKSHNSPTSSAHIFEFYDGIYLFCTVTTSFPKLQWDLTAHDTIQWNGPRTVSLFPLLRPTPPQTVIRPGRNDLESSFRAKSKEEKLTDDMIGQSTCFGIRLVSFSLVSHFD